MGVSALRARLAFAVLVVLVGVGAWYVWQVRPSANVRVANQAASFVAERTTYAPGEVVTLTFKNIGKDPLELLTTGPYAVFAAGSSVATFQSSAGETVQPGESRTWQWDQRDASGQQVADGAYTLTAQYRVAGTVATARTEVAVRRPQPVNGTPGSGSATSEVKINFDSYAAGSALPQGTDLLVRLSSANGQAARVFSNPGACGPQSEASSQPNFAVGSPSSLSPIVLTFRSDVRPSTVSMTLISVGAAGVTVTYKDATGAVLKEEQVANANSGNGCAKQNIVSYVADQGKQVATIEVRGSSDGFGLDDVTFSSPTLVGTNPPASTPPVTTPPATPSPVVVTPGTTPAGGQVPLSVNFDSEPVNEALNQAKFRDQGVLVASYASAQPHVAANTKPCSGSAGQYKQMVIGRSPAGSPSASEPVQFFPSRSGYVAKKVTVAVLTGNTPFQASVYALDMSGKVISSQTVEQPGGDCNQVKTVTVEHPGGISQVGVVSGASTQTLMNVTSTPNIKDYQAKFGVAKVDVEWVAEPTGTPKTYPSLPILTNQAGRSGEAVLATTGTSTLQWQLSTPKAAFREFESVPVSVKNTGLYPVSMQGVDYGVYCTGANDTVRVGGGAFIAEYPVALAPGQTVVIPSFLDSTSLRCSGPNRMVRIGVGSATNPGRIELVVQSSNAAARTVPNWCLPFMQTYISACRP